MILELKRRIFLMETTTSILIQTQPKTAKLMGSTPIFDVLIIGAGPIGMACAIEAERWGLSYQVVEKGCLVNSIYNYPTNMHFFSTPDLLELGGVPFITQNDKPSRLEALEYYRRVALDLQLHINVYEKVLEIEGQDGDFTVLTTKSSYQARKIVAAIGFFDHARRLGVPGETADKVHHFYKEPHPYAGQDLLIVGSGNSAVEAALECQRHGARVTMAVRGTDFHEGLKYWIRPDIENRIQSGSIVAYFSTTVHSIAHDSVILQNEDLGEFSIENQFVLSLIGYEPDYSFLERIGVPIGTDECRHPILDPETWESRRAGIYLAGVVVGGLDTKTWFIENSRQHAVDIFKDIAAKSAGS